MLRLTAVNACGQTSTAETTVYVDKDFDSLTIREPLDGAIVGGNVCFDGTVADSYCMDEYVVEYRPAAGGDFQPVDPNHPVYTSPVINDPFAEWVDAPGLPDGDYEVRVVGRTDCGHTASETLMLAIDNTAPIAEIASPPACSKLDGVVEFTGTAFDEHLRGWTLEYYDPPTRRWVTIGSGSQSTQSFGSWDTSSLPPCYYVVRLRVSDAAIVNLCGNPGNHNAAHYLAVAVGDPCPGDLDGDGEIGLSDLAALLSVYGTSCD
jgi:hypothetical protein